SGTLSTSATRGSRFPATTGAQASRTAWIRPHRAPASWAIRSPRTAAPTAAGDASTPTTIGPQAIARSLESTLSKSGSLHEGTLRIRRRNVTFVDHGRQSDDGTGQSELRSLMPGHRIFASVLSYISRLVHIYRA